MTTFSEAQDRVFDEAYNRLKDKDWFKGVCCDDFPPTKLCEEEFERAVNRVVDKTAMWDSPTMYVD